MTTSTHITASVGKAGGRSRHREGAARERRVEGYAKSLRETIYRSFSKAEQKPTSFFDTLRMHIDIAKSRKSGAL